MYFCLKQKLPPMKFISFNIVFGLFIAVLLSCQPTKQEIQHSDEEAFTFAFLTDIHLQPERNAVAGFQKAIDTVNNLNPDFVITGGDLIMDALGQSYGRSDSLYKLYMEAQSNFNMPVYNTIGNHEIFGIYEKSGVVNTHPEYGEKMFENRIGERFYSFDYENWHFMILDGIEDTGEGSYIGYVDSVQMDWIRGDLNQVDEKTPIVISIHIPLLTVLTQLEKGALEPNGTSTVVNNAKEVLELFNSHNLKLVLQGHLHFVEDIEVNGTRFITGGAVSARWWSGPHRGLEEGFALFNVCGDEFTWNYVDFEWEVDSPGQK